VIDAARVRTPTDYPEDSVIPSRGCQVRSPAVIGSDSSG